MRARSGANARVAPDPSRGPDPRALVLATLAYVGFVASFPRHAFVALAPLALGAALGVALAPVTARALGVRLAWAAPFALAVGVASPWLEPRPVAGVGGVVLSAGTLALGVLVLKVLLCVTALTVLGALVPLGPLTEALRGLGLPRVLVGQVALLGRYLELLRHEAARMRRARALRSGGSARALRPRVVGAMAGVLVVRALERGARVHRAMLARGFDGTLPALERSRWRLRDTALVAAVVAGCALVRLAPLTTWLGWSDAGAHG
ncbi:MAG: cobalt ECF transporter T component CbiQ [Myxococcales bacterium]|nr:cobalt ECF transporter T component CbiQ [Myxococcales bacterium]